MYNRKATHYLLNALMFEEFSDFERAIINYETAYNSSNAEILSISKAINEYYLGNNDVALHIFENIPQFPDQLVKYKYYQYILSNIERKEFVSSELLNELIGLYSQDSSKSKLKEGMFLLEKLLKNYKKYNKAADFELFMKDIISRDISQIYKEYFSAVLFKFYSKVEKNNDKVTEYVDNLIRNYKDSDYKHLVFVFDELIESKNLENAEKIYKILKEVRYLDPEYYIFNYSLEVAKGNHKKAMRILGYAQDSFPGVFFEILSLQQYLDQKEVKNATILFNKLQLKYPKNLQIYQKFIISLIDNDFIDKAIEIYEITIDKFPKNTVMRNNYAYLLAGYDKDLDKAISLAIGAVEKEPDNVSFLDTLAWIYYIKGDYKNAEEYIERIFNLKEVLLDPNSKELYEHYTKIKTKLNKLDNIDKIQINELAIVLHECVNSAMSLLK